jgi:hypothetical protein
LAFKFEPLHVALLSDIVLHPFKFELGEPSVFIPGTPLLASARMQYGYAGALVATALETILDAG